MNEYKFNDLLGRRVIDVEFMYRPRPTDSTDIRILSVYDTMFLSRLSALDPAQDAVLLIVNSLATVGSLQPLLQQFPNLLWMSCIANPVVWPDSANMTVNTPRLCKWPTPEKWQRFQQSDRWSRINAAFEIASKLNPNSYLIMPAHDALWGRNLLSILLAKSVEYASGGLPSAVSPYSYYRHSAVNGIEIPSDMIDLINVAFNRDASFSIKLGNGDTQGFWGKTALIPCAMCGEIRTKVDQTFFEDDAEIDRVIRDLGYAARGLWTDDQALYRQVLPVFDETSARRIILRTLHYSLPAGGSALLAPLDEPTRNVYLQHPYLWQVNARAEQIINDCQLEIQERVDQFGASWIDWGPYRYVVRIGDPMVEVWQPCE